jgi:hypothetical protein
MIRSIFLGALVLLLGLAVTASAQGFGQGLGDGTGECQFVDEDGDGFNDLAPDADGDGIPNGQDPDYVRPEDGTGNQYAHQHAMQNGQGFRHGQFGEDAGEGLLTGLGDGECDGTGAPEGVRRGNAYGPGDGTGIGEGPADGTGFGPGDGTGIGDGDGECDGSGSPLEGRGQRRGGR